MPDSKPGECRVIRHPVVTAQHARGKHPAENQFHYYWIPDRASLVRNDEDEMGLLHTIQEIADVMLK